jgi:stress response protein SCP2
MAACNGHLAQHTLPALHAHRTTTLDGIKQPYVSVTDPATGMELCSYAMDTVSKAERVAHTSIVMCRVYRTPGRQWAVQAVGRLGQGKATNTGYKLIEATIAAVRNGC